MNGAGDQLVLGQVPEPVTLTRLEDDARRSDELGHHDSLGAVDDEGPLLGHHREVPHEDCLLLDLAGVGVHEAGPYKDRGGEGHVLLLALLHRELGRRAKVLVLGIEFQLKRERLTEVRDRTEVRERVGDPVPTEPLEGLPLDVDQVWQREDFLQIAERITVPNEGASRHLELLAESHERGQAGNATGACRKQHVRRTRPRQQGILVSARPIAQPYGQHNQTPKGRPAANGTRPLSGGQAPSSNRNA